MQATFLFLTFGVVLGLVILLTSSASYLVIVGAILGTLAIVALPDCYSKVTRLCLHLQWWHYMWALMLLSGLVFRIRDTSVAADSPIDAWALYRVALVIVIGMVLSYHLAIHRTDWIRSLSQGVLSPLTAYAALSLISVTWSVYPSWSLYKSTEYFVDLALMAAIVTAAKDIKSVKTLVDWTWLLLTRTYLKIA